MSAHNYPITTNTILPIVINDATQTDAGVMSAADKIKLDSLTPGAGGGTEFVFQPGGTPGDGVYDDWTTLMTACDLVVVPRTIFFDSSFAPCVVPAGTWNMKDVAWSGILGLGRVAVEVQEGAIFTNFRSINFHLAINFTGTTPPVSDFSSVPDGDFFVLGTNSKITPQGAGPFFHNSTVGSFAALLLDAGEILPGSTECIQVDAGCAFAFAGLEEASLRENTVDGAVGSLMFLLFGAASARLSLDQPNFLGTVLQQNDTLVRQNPTSVQVGPGSFNAAPGDLVLCDSTGGDVNVGVPDPALYKGQQIVVKNQSNDAVNNINILAATGTVDGGGMLVINGSRVAVVLQSDGVSDWVVVAAYNFP